MLVPMTQSREVSKTAGNNSGHQSATRAEPDSAWQTRMALSRRRLSSPYTA